MELASYPREKLDDRAYQQSATFWAIPPSEQFLVPASSLDPGASSHNTSLLGTHHAQYAINRPLARTDKFGPLLHQPSTVISVDDLLSTPALTATSLAPTPPSGHSHSHVFVGSPQGFVPEPSLTHSNNHNDSQLPSLSTSPVESCLSSCDGEDSPGDSDGNWQPFSNQQQHQQHESLDTYQSTLIFNPSYTLHHQPVDVKVNMNNHDEMFDFIQHDAQYPLFPTTPMMMQQTISHDMTFYQSPAYQASPMSNHSTSLYQSNTISSAYQYNPQEPTTSPPVDDCSEFSSDNSDDEPDAIARTSSRASSSMSTTSHTRTLVKKKVHVVKTQTKVIFGPVEHKEKAPRKVGRRQGPLQPDQRKRASEIRKVRACLRCRCLKKTCDPGSPCAACQPQHARLWNVPCTRLDVRDLGYFMYDWKDDMQGIITNPEEIQIYGHSTTERVLYIGHGFGIVMPIAAHDVYVYNETSLTLDWTETHLRYSKDFSARTACMSISNTGINKDMLSEYLDRHIDNGWFRFVDQHFEGTPFLTEMLKTAHTYYVSTKLPIVRTALKLVLAYNLTLHISIVEGPLEECHDMIGRINDPSSKYCGKVAAPTLINHRVKHDLSRIWRDLHKEVLEELSTLISGVYGRDKMKNWPTIFMVTYLVLSIWEQLRFDAVRRCRDLEEAEKFCKELDGVPVLVVVGLFAAISQKLPSFKTWSTYTHHHILASERAACKVMEEVKDHVLVHDAYLRTRPAADYNEENFDSLANKFTSMIIKN